MVDNGYREEPLVSHGITIKNVYVKYFIHGFVYSIFMLAFTFVWTFILLFLVLIGMIIGLCLGCCFLFVVIGAMNAYLGDYLWSISANYEWKHLTGHGGAFFIILIFAHLPMFIVGLLSSPGTFILISILSLVVNSFIDGYIGRRIAQSFSETRPQEVFRAPRGIPATCPECGARFYYLQSNIWPDGTVYCQNCRLTFQIQSHTGPDIDNREDSFKY
jgi:hypothetical protein